MKWTQFPLFRIQCINFLTITLSLDVRSLSRVVVEKSKYFVDTSWWCIHSNWSDSSPDPSVAWQSSLSGSCPGSSPSLSSSPPWVLANHDRNIILMRVGNIFPCRRDKCWIIFRMFTVSFTRIVIKLFSWKCLNVQRICLVTGSLGKVWRIK